MRGVYECLHWAAHAHIGLHEQELAPAPAIDPSTKAERASSRQSSVFGWTRRIGRGSHYLLLFYFLNQPHLFLSDRSTDGRRRPMWRKDRATPLQRNTVKQKNYWIRNPTSLLPVNQTRKEPRFCPHSHQYGTASYYPFRMYLYYTRPGSNPNLPVFRSLVQHEIGALDQAANEAGVMRYCRVARRCVALVATLGVLTVLLLLGAPPTAPPRRYIPPSQPFHQPYAKSLYLVHAVIWKGIDVNDRRYPTARQAIPKPADIHALSRLAPKCLQPSQRECDARQQIINTRARYSRSRHDTAKPSGTPFTNSRT
uniref:Uncharacterized protein n=1 Tax=Timema douglasi TaxID=61478 RepID=A0A7R8VFI3_TIMDO|nr:unnamed protein product [Timema douglasi]